MLDTGKESLAACLVELPSGVGVFVADSTSASVEVMLLCQAEVLARIAPGAPLHNLCETEINELMDCNAEKYRRSGSYRRADFHSDTISPLRNQSMFIENILRKVEFKGRRRLIRYFFGAREGILDHSKSKIYFDTFSLIGFEMYWGGGYEKEVTWIYDYFVETNFICLDVGANIGVHTVILCEKCQHVHAFEPHPIFRKRLKSNIDLNKFANVTIHSSGVSNFSGTATLHAPPPEMKNKSATICDINDELTERIEIEITELDKMDDKTSRFQFMKIDCDGSDAAIILGGKNILKKYKPIILFEDMSWYLSNDLHDCNRIKNEYTNAYNLLRSIGYDIYGIRNKYLVKLEDEPSGYENVLAVHGEDKCNIIARSLEKKY